MSGSSDKLPGAAPRATAAARALYKVAKSLADQGLSTDALPLFEELCASFPELSLGWLGTARIASAETRWEDAAAEWGQCLARFPEEAAPGWFANRVRALSMLDRDDEAALVTAELVTRFPSNPLPAIRAARAAEMRRDTQLADRLWSGLAAAHPDDKEVVTGRVRSVAARGNADDARALLRAAEGRLEPVAATLLEADILHLSGETGAALALLAERDAGDSRLAIKALSLRAGAIACRADAALLVDGARSFVAQNPQRLDGLLALAEALVVADNGDDALALVAAQADRFARCARGRRLLAWSAARRGDQPAATRWSERAYAQGYRFALDAPMGSFAAPAEPITPAPGEILLISVMRNEADYVEAFLAHHRAIGVSRFLIVDNGSDDATPELLQRAPDVHLFSTTDSFAAAGGGMRWVNHLIELHGRANWCVYVDADEQLILPDGVHHLGEWTAQLEARGIDAAAGFMVDMVPERWSACDAYRPGDDPRTVSDRFVADYEMLGAVDCPWFDAVGGARRQLFGTTEKLRKVPLLRGGSGARYVDSHSITAVPVAPLAVGLLHFKLLRQYLAATEMNAAEHARIASRSALSSARNRRFVDHLARFDRDAPIVLDQAETFVSAGSLEAHGFLRRLDQPEEG